MLEARAVCEHRSPHEVLRGGAGDGPLLAVGVLRAQAFRSIRLPVRENLEAQGEGPNVLGVLEALDVALIQDVLPEGARGLALEEAVV
jgi:hypothetical protein